MNYKTLIAFLGKNQMKDWATKSWTRDFELLPPQTDPIIVRRWTQNQIDFIQSIWGAEKFREPTQPALKSVGGRWISLKKVGEILLTYDQCDEAQFETAVPDIPGDGAVFIAKTKLLMIKFINMPQDDAINIMENFYTEIEKIYDAPTVQEFRALRVKLNEL
jgi:hypothetical protein